MPSSLFELLLTSHQIAEEVKPVMYKQRIDLDGQAELFRWLRESDRTCFTYTEDVAFKLYDIDPQKIVGALGKRLRQSAHGRDAQSPPADNPYRQACQAEVDRILHGFSMLPNVKKLTLRRCIMSDPRPPRHMSLAFAEGLATQMPQLQQLIIEDESFSLRPISSFKKLRALSFTGLSVDDPSDMPGIFSSLEDLIGLEIYRPDPNLDDAHIQQRSGRPELRRCQPAQLLENLPYSLQMFTFHETSKFIRSHNLGQQLVDTVQTVIGALEDHANLTQLDLRSSAKFSEPIRSHLASLISNAPLKDLELFVDDFLSFEMLPKSIMRVVWRFSRSHMLTVAFITGLVTKAKEQHQRLSELASIIIYTHGKPTEPEVREHQERAFKLLRVLGISLFWDCWDAPLKIGA